MIKRIIFALAIIFTFALAPISSVYADGEGSSTNCRYFLGLKSWDCNVNTTEIQGQDDLSAAIWTIVVNVLDDVTIVAAYLIIGYIIYGGYMYTLSAGEANKITEGKKIIIHGITGLAIISVANIAMNTIRWILLRDQTTLPMCATTTCINPSTLFTNSIQWAIAVAGLVSLIFVVYGGISYATSSGDAAKAKKAKDMILYAIVGLIIVALAEAIAIFVTNIINSATT